MNVFDEIINFFKTKNIFCKNKMRDNNACISILSIKNYIRDQINFMNNKENMKQMENIYNKRLFLFIYKGIENKNLNSNHDIKQFQQNQFIAAKFSIYTINFKSKTISEGIFHYKFLLWSIYLIK